MAITYAGLVSLGLPEDSLRSFPEAFRVGMAARAGTLRDSGLNDPTNWEKSFGTGEIHIGVSVFSDSEQAWRDAMRTAQQQYQGFAGVTVLMTQDFGAQPGDLNPMGYRDSISQPAIEGSGIEPLPGQGHPSKPVSSSSVMRRRGGRAAAECRIRKCWDETAPTSACASIRSRVGTFNRFLREPTPRPT